MFTVSLEILVKEFDLEIVTCEEHISDIRISSINVNRPGLELAGFNESMDASRIQIVGETESTYIRDFMDPEKKKQKIDSFFAKGFPVLVITKGLPIDDDMIEASVRYGIPLLRTKQESSRFLSALIAELNLELAPRISIHGVLVEVYGEGCLIMGDSGVGKSETAMELVKRGHRLVADDVVEVRRVSEKTIVGTSPNQIRHFLEIRGIGIVDVKNLFGMGAIKLTERIDLVINLENWVQGKPYERLGMNTTYTNILDNKIPSLVIPVKPGRNLAIIIEVAAMNNRQKKMGYNAAEYLNQRLMDTINHGTQEEGSASEVFNPRISK